VNSRYLTPKHSDKRFIDEVADIVKKERIDFVHPQPSTEALVISSSRMKIRAKMLLPPSKVMALAQDKLLSQRLLSRAGLPVAKTKTIRRLADVRSVFAELGKPLWIRARHGAGGRLSLLCSTSKEASHWIELWANRGIDYEEFMLQEYLPGRNIALDSLWKDGELVTSYTRERLEYPFKHISPSGITGTPSVARTIHDDKVNDIAEKAVKVIDSNASGSFSIDIKESSEGAPCITEVDAGKFHSTMPLWGYVALKHLKMPWYANLADLYVRLGLDDKIGDTIPKVDLIPEGYYLLRDMDVGAYLWREDGWKEKVL
jgi:carbamoyl-phosphate synthase large subunit